MNIQEEEGKKKQNHKISNKSLSKFPLEATKDEDDDVEQVIHSVKKLDTYHSRLGSDLFEVFIYLFI